MSHDYLTLAEVIEMHRQLIGQFGGSQRIAFFATDTFLRVNGRWIDCDDAETYQSFMAMFEQGSFDFHHLETWLRNHVRPLG